MDTALKIKIDNFYISCMSCNNSSKQCPGIQKDISKGIPPRGFYYKTSPVDILVVGKNPGHTFKGESENYINKTGKELFNTYRHHQDKYYNDPDSLKERSNIFHKNLFSYIRNFLDIKEEDGINAIYSRIAHTNIVKCSTVDETGKLAKKTIEECYNKFFLTELELFKPNVILALGREVEKFLKRKEIGIPIIYVKHPSYHYRKEELEEILDNIKLQISKFLNKIRVSKKPKTCPVCGSNRIATYLLGMPDFSNTKIQKEIDEGKIIIGGCCISDDDPKYHCHGCDTDFYFFKNIKK